MGFLAAPEVLDNAHLPAAVGAWFAQCERDDFFGWRVFLLGGLCGLMCVATKDDLHAQMEFDDTSVVLVIGSEGITDPNIFERIMAGNV
ncbi:MAG: hypothetical protein HOH68_06315 [Rhodobacteraceae bacterium]|nr:hypothetical protein [Paracoccaceae bacterium]